MNNTLQNISFFTKSLAGSLVLTWCVACASVSTELKYTIPSADLVTLDSAALDSLKDVEHGAFEAKVALEKSTAEETKAKDYIEEAEKVLAGKEANVKAAQAEVKAARLNGEQLRLSEAQLAERKALHEVDVTHAEINWARQAYQAHKAVREAAEIGLAKAEAERELARAKLLADQRVAAAEKYAIVDFREQLNKLNAAQLKANENVEDREHDAKKAKSSLERLKAKQQ